MNNWQGTVRYVRLLILKTGLEDSRILSTINKIMTAKDFLMALPKKVSKDAIEGMETLFHFDLDGDDGGQYTLELKDGALNVIDGLEGDAKCAIRGKAKNFIKLAQGDINPMMAILTGKVKISNQGEMLKYAKIFGLL